MSRDAEMGWILAKLKRPEPAAFVLAGAPGVGKTRLASEAAKSAAGLGFITAQAVASRAAAAIPFGPFAPFLPEAGYSPGDRYACRSPRPAAWWNWSRPGCPGWRPGPSR